MQTAENKSSEEVIIAPRPWVKIPLKP